MVAVEPGSIATKIWEKGGDTMAEQVGQMPREAKRLYGAQLKGMGRALEETGARGIEPEAVAKVIGRALGRRRPRTRYLVGTDAKIMRRMNGVLSDRTFDRLKRRSMKLSNEAPPGR